MKIAAQQAFFCLLNLSLIFSSVSTSIADDDNQAPFSEIIVFGDSYSDTGNFFEFTEGAFPNAPYYDGRASNGLLWIEFLAESLTLTLSPENQYAYLGAESGTENFNNQSPAIEFPGFHQQVGTFLADNEELDPNASSLYVIWIGSYDFYSWLANGGKDPSQIVESSITNIVTGLSSLVDYGATHFLVVNLPDLGAIPIGKSLGSEISELLTISSVTFNSLLDDAIVAMAQLQDIHITRLDAFGIINTLIEAGDAFGFENVEDPALAISDPNTVDSYLFWDSTHPTSAGHKILADFALQALIESYSQNGEPATQRDSNHFIKAAFEIPRYSEINPHGR